MRLYRIGTLATDTEAGIKQIFGVATAQFYHSLDFPFGTFYQVPAGKTLYVTHFIISSTDANMAFYFGYGDDAVPNQAAAPTNAVQVSNTFFIQSAYSIYPLNFFVPIPALKYPYIKSAAAVSIYVTALGVEVQN